MLDSKQAQPIADIDLWGYDPSELQTTTRRQQEIQIPLICQDYLPLEVQKQLARRDQIQ